MNRVDDRLVADLEALLAEQRRCGDLDAGMIDGEPARVWLACSCGARIKRPA